MYCTFKLLANWKLFKVFVKKTKQTFFDEKIQEIVSKRKRPCDFINWVRKQKLPAIEALQFNI